MKILDRGYWISLHFYWQSIVHYLLGALRFKSMTYFSVCNPAIDLGGMLEDRKTDIYALLPRHIVPITTIIKDRASTLQFMSEVGLHFPVIIKPNVGLKGYKVTKVNSEIDFDAFLMENDISGREWLMQEYLDQPYEFSVLFYKYPLSGKYGISSFIEKIYPYIKGDGVTDFKTLLRNYKNPFLQREEVYKRFGNMMETVPTMGEVIVLDVIGNYSRGAKFYSKMDAITPKMIDMLYSLFKGQDGINFFRIDLKADSMSALEDGRFKVLEINGMKSEPIHIYDPCSTFIGNASTIKHHWSIINDIANEQQSYDSPAFAYGLKSLKSIKKMIK